MVARYRTERVELKNRDRELEKERWRKTKYSDELSDREEGIKNWEGEPDRDRCRRGEENQHSYTLQVGEGGINT